MTDAIEMPSQESTGGRTTRVDEETENVVNFEGPEDPSNPVNWSNAYKWTIVGLISVMSLVVNLAILMCAPATPEILREFHSTSQLESTILVSIWELGEVVGPLLVGPLSEMYGRLPVYHIANILFVVFSIAAAKSINIQMLIGFRFLLGLTVASTTLNPSIVGDMFKLEDRGRALSVMGMTPFIAPVLGPTIGGFISQAKGWRWTFWFVTITTGAFEICFLALYRESYKVKIIEAKARRLRGETGNKKLRSHFKKRENSSGFGLLGQSMFRPIQLLFTSPIVLLVSVCGAFAISYTYIVITSISLIFELTYKFSAGAVGLSYLGLGFGMISSVILCGIYLDSHLKKKSQTGPPKPEHRLPLMIVDNVLVPIGLIGFGWTAQSHIHWVIPVLFTAIVGFGFVAVSLVSWNYLIDVFDIHAASATAATTVLRNMSAAALPLAGPALYKRVGLGKGNTVLGAIALLFALVPMVLMRLGERMRGWKRFQAQM